MFFVIIFTYLRTLRYTHAHLWFPPSFLAVNHHHSKNWVPSILKNNLWLFSWEWSKKKIFFLKKKIQNGRLKKTEFFNFVKSWAISAKISWIGPWVSRIDWCEGHWRGSTYMVVRLSSITPKPIHSIVPWTSCSWVRSKRVKYPISHSVNSNFF